MLDGRSGAMTASKLPAVDPVSEPAPPLPAGLPSWSRVRPSASLSEVSSDAEPAIWVATVSAARLTSVTAASTLASSSLWVISDWRMKPMPTITRVEITNVTATTRSSSERL